MKPEEIRQTIASQIAKIYLGEVDSEPTQEEIELEAKIQEYLDSDEFKEAFHILHQNMVLGLPMKYQIKDGKIKAEQYQLGGDCEICKKDKK